jgi:hypothetical protein
MGLATKYKVCVSCDKRIQIDDAECWNCKSRDFKPLPGFEPQPESPAVAMDENIAAQLETLRDFHQWFTRKEIAHLPEVLHRGEQIKALTSGRHRGNSWLIVVTDQRIVFLDKGLVFGLQQVDYPLHQISALSHKTGLIFGELHIATSGDHCIIERIPKDEAGKVAAIISTLVRNTHEPDPPAATTATPITDPAGVASQLERLAELMEKGLLTKEEFDAQKAKLLS